MKYYKVTQEELNLIKDKLPKNIAFGFESYEKYYFSSEELNRIKEAHGSIIELAIKVSFDKEMQEFLLEKESLEFEAGEIQAQKQADGEEAYAKLTGYMTQRKGLGEKLDTEIIPAFRELFNIRCLLKDGAFDIALRYWATIVVPLGIISEEDSEYVVDIISQLAKKYGDSEEKIGALIGAPMGAI